MTLEMYINGKMVDRSFLNIYKMAGPQEREQYIQGAVSGLLEKWSDLVEDQGLTPEFFLKSHPNSMKG